MLMTIPELINAIGEKHKNDGFAMGPPASEKMIADFEKKIGGFLQSGKISSLLVSSANCKRQKSPRI